MRWRDSNGWMDWLNPDAKKNFETIDTAYLGAFDIASSA